MASAESSKLDVKSGAEVTHEGRAVVALTGTYAFRFSGYAMPSNRPYYLAGLGRFQIDANGNLSGKHRSAIMPIQGMEAKLTTGFYDLNGTIEVGPDGSGQASILFTRTGGTGSGLNVKGDFHVQVAEKQMWLVSAGGIVPETGARAEELVNLEAIRLA